MVKCPLLKEVKKNERNEVIEEIYHFVLMNKIEIQMDIAILLKKLQETKK